MIGPSTLMCFCPASLVAAIFQPATVLPLRAGAGDNVNCFNLNTTSQPQLLGVPARRLAELGAFRPKASGTVGVEGWNLLARKDDGAVPAFVDENTLLWALKRKVGDELEYADEAGRTFRVRIVGTITDSIFQGYLLIDEAALLAEAQGGQAVKCREGDL